MATRHALENMLLHRNGRGPLVCLDDDAAALPDSLRALAGLRRDGLPVPPFGLVDRVALDIVADHGVADIAYVIPDRRHRPVGDIAHSLAEVWHHTARGGLAPVRVGAADRARPALTGRLVKSWHGLRSAIGHAAADGGPNGVLVSRAVEPLLVGSVRSLWTLTAPAAEVTISADAATGRPAVILRAGRWRWRRPTDARQALERDLRQELHSWVRLVLDHDDIHALAWATDQGGSAWIVDASTLTA